ncbi:hypothetical protein GCM10025331_19890 [Actinoplanes utahensis]|nr:hypothetical protein Aut01nite_37490 [Actinoplanes utahensis]
MIPRKARTAATAITHERPAEGGPEDDLGALVSSGADGEDAGPKPLRETRTDPANSG